MSPKQRREWINKVISEHCRSERDYFNDLNEMFYAEQHLSSAQCEPYEKMLYDIRMNDSVENQRISDGCLMPPPPWVPHHFSSQQRAISYVKAVGKWNPPQ